MFIVLAFHKRNIKSPYFELRYNFKKFLLLIFKIKVNARKPGKGMGNFPMFF